MKFTLTYDGDLPSTGNGSKKVARKSAIRRHFHPQLEELWRIHPALRSISATPTFPVGGSMLMQTHHADPGPITLRPLALMDTGQKGTIGAATRDKQAIPLAPPIMVGKKTFMPLVRNSLSLNCSLEILFLRKEGPGRVYQGGDLDNRIKTLLDALSVPQDPSQVVSDPSSDAATATHCLVEDDALITGLSVRTERLLGAPDASQSDVRLVVNVDVRVSDARIYNQSFLGD